MSLSSRSDFFLNLSNRKLPQVKVRKAKARNVFSPSHAFGLRPFKIKKTAWERENTLVGEITPGSSQQDGGWH
uniref:Uncharacterized protein n=1 Tax=Caenorhabditis japonica TaxID=281687 RepID=A0A8R1I6Y7_CAEJA